MRDLARFKFLLRPEDQESYARGSEWFLFDIEEIDRTVPTDDVMALEEALGHSLDGVVNGLVFGSTRAKLSAFWVARRLAGIEEKLDFFRPRVRAAAISYLDDEKVAEAPGDAPAEGAGDAGPPAGTASAEEPRSS